MTKPRKPKHRPSNNPFPAGMRIGVLQVLDMSRDAPYAKGKSWWVRYTCCGLETERNYSSLSSFMNDPPGACARCARHGRLPAPPPDVLALAALAALQKRRALAAIQPAAAWPRPPSLAGKRPVVWGAQP